MKIIYILWCLFLVFSAHAQKLKKPRKISISQTFSLQIPFEIKNEVELISMRSKYYEINQSPNTSQILVMHHRPPTFANKFSVERYWKESQLLTQSTDKNKKDQGCVGHTSRFYQCTREVLQNSESIAEALFWNTKNDLVLVRVNSKSLVEARKILDQIKATPNSRLPAGSKK